MENSQPPAVKATDAAKPDAVVESKSPTTAPRPRARKKQAPTLLDIVQNDTDILAQLALFGYTTKQLAEGSAHQKVLLQANLVHQYTVAAQTQTRAAFYTLHGQARRAYITFCERAGSTLAAYNLVVPPAPEATNHVRQFVALAHETYRAVLQTAETHDALAAAGYARAEIERLDVEIDSVAQAERAHAHARKRVRLARQQRDGALLQWEAWLARLNDITRHALRNRPDLVARLDKRDTL